MSTDFPKVNEQALADDQAAGELLWSPSGGNQDDSIGGNAHLYSYRFRDDAGRWRAETILVDIGLLHLSKFYGNDEERIDTPDHSHMMPTAEAAEGMVRSQVDKPVIGAILITHGHSDHIAGLAAHIQSGAVTPPIYASKYSAFLIRSHLASNGIDKDHWPEIHEIKPGDKLKLSDRLNVEVTGATHSIPQALSFLIETPTARHFHSGDIKVDEGSLVAGGTDLKTLREWGERGIDSALIDSTGAPKDGWAKREQEVREDAFREVSKHPSKRVTYAVLGSYVEQLAGLGEVAARTGRALVYGGKSVETHLTALRVSGIDLPKLVEERTGKKLRILDINSDEARALKPSQALQLVTGVDGDDRTVLAQAAKGKHDSWSPSADDVVVWPDGYRTAAPEQANAMDRALRQRRVNVRRIGKRSDFGEGHGRREDLKEILSALKPKVLIPTHGVPFMRKALMDLGVQYGAKGQDALNGDIFRLARNGVKLIAKRVANWMPANKTHYPDQPRFNSVQTTFDAGKGPEDGTRPGPPPKPAA